MLDAAQPCAHEDNESCNPPSYTYEEIEQGIDDFFPDDAGSAELNK